MKYQQVKVEHQHSRGLLHLFPILQSKWEVVIRDFITKLPDTSRQHNYEGYLEQLCPIGIPCLHITFGKVFFNIWVPN